MMEHGRMMRLADIRIPEKFAAHPPKEEKVQARMRHASGRPLSVCVNSMGWLTDQYASYIAAEKLGKDRILAAPGKETVTVVEAVFHKGGKSYVWEVPDSIMAGFKKKGFDPGPGFRLAVRTASGVRQVTAVRFGKAPFPTEHAEVLGAWSREKYRPAQCAEHARLCREIGSYCQARGIASLEGFLEAAAGDEDARHLYQFASGRWANAYRLEQILEAIRNPGQDDKKDD